MKTKILHLLVVAALVFVGCENRPETSGTSDTPTSTEYAITVSGSTGGTAVAMAGGEVVAKAVAGTVITIRATPDEGYEFEQWVSIGAAPDDSTAASTTFTMPARTVNIEAVFSAIIVPPTEYSITVGAAANGTITATVEGGATTKAIVGTEVTLTATPDDGYVLKEWCLTGATLVNNTAAVVKFRMPEGDVTIAAEFIVNPAVIDEGVVINGVKWATRNIDAPGTFAATPENPGMFYQWNRRTGWSVNDPLVSSPAGKSWDSTNEPGNEWSRTNDPSPRGWRAPLVSHFRALLDTEKVDRVLLVDRNDEFFGVRFTDKETGNTIFFPTPGGRNGSTGGPRVWGREGYYWSREKSVLTDYGPNMLLSLQLLHHGGQNYRNSGYSVRPVAE